MGKITYNNVQYGIDTSADIIDSIEDSSASGSEDKLISSKAFNEMNDKFGGAQFNVEDGKIYWKATGADTWSPFKGGPEKTLLWSQSYGSYSGSTISLPTMQNYTYILIVLESSSSDYGSSMYKYSQYKCITIPTSLCPSSANVMAYTVSGKNNGYRYERSFYLYENSIKFNSGYYNQFDGSTYQHNKVFVPVKIYGLNYDFLS